MPSLAVTERIGLCDTALASGPTAPTLCGDWDVKDLVIHLLTRERDPIGSPGILVPALDGLTERAHRRLAKQDFDTLVTRLRAGPPRWMPYGLPLLHSALNTLEFFVHHEDIRRAAPSWEPRALDADAHAALWRTLRIGGRGLVRPAGVPVAIRQSEDDKPVTLRSGDQPVLITGPAPEVTMFLFGRAQTRDLRFHGPQAKVTALRETKLGL